MVFFAEILIEDFDGASRTIYNIIRSIPRDRFDVLFICGVPPQGSFDFPYFVVPTVSLPFNKDYKMALPQLIYFKVIQKLNQFNPDIIHISTPSPMGKFAINFAKDNNIPVTSIYHTHFISYIDYYLEKTPSLIAPVKKWLSRDQKLFYEKCKIVYVPTQNMVTELETLGISSSNFKIWPRGLHKERFNPSKRDLQKIKSITGNDSKNIIFASRLVWEKNLKTLIRIYQQVKTQQLKFNFIIAGEGVAKESLKKLMPDAYFLGHVHHDELAVIYASCDIFLFTSVSETYGNVVAEAMASGLPCVIANGGGSAHFIEHGINGFLCKPEDCSDYVEKLNLLIENESLSTEFSQKGLSFASTLQWDRLTKTYFNDLENIYHEKEENYVIPTGMEFSF